MINLTLFILSTNDEGLRNCTDYFYLLGGLYTQIPGQGYFSFPKKMCLKSLYWS